MSFLNPVSDILFKNGRMIEKISGFITIQEATKDELEITQQPVQAGATISDHAFKKPTFLSMQIQFDKANALAAIAGSAASFIGTQIGGIIGGAAGAIPAFLIAQSGNDVLKQTYQKLLDLQSSFLPFTIMTPKREYPSMLIQSLGVTTDKKTENVLSLTAIFQQVIIVNISVVTVDRQNQQNPAVTGATQNAGKKSSIIYDTAGIFGDVVNFLKGL